jgi:hypothetical protein
MPDDTPPDLKQFDEMLSEVLPDDPEHIKQDAVGARKAEVIELLRKAADELGKSPSVREFDELNIDTSSRTIRNIFDSWNDAKREAGLEISEIGGDTRVDINETYFKRINTAEKAYWLGTLFAHSSISQKNYAKALQINRAKDREFFVRGLRKAVGSVHSINEYTSNNTSEQDTVQLGITNSTFVDHLISAGYPGSKESVGNFPSLSEEHCPAFVRGYLESAGYFSTNGWSVPVDSEARAETFQSLFSNFGAKRVTISESADHVVAAVLVSNVFDIKSIFETCWPGRLETDPSWTPYPQKVLDHLQREYPYPSNVSYLSE